MPISEETSIRVQVQDTTVMAIYEVQGNTLVLASADFGDAQAPLKDAQPGEVANKLRQPFAKAAIIQGDDPLIRDDGSLQQGQKDKIIRFVQRCRSARYFAVFNGVAMAPLR